MIYPEKFSKNLNLFHLPISLNYIYECFRVITRFFNLSYTIYTQTLSHVGKYDEK